MKLERLYTLGQFVDVVMKDRPFQNELNNDTLELADSMVIVHEYSSFLKQPLKKEMFVCEVEEPTDMYKCDQYYGCEMDKYKEAQKKVIFDRFDVDLFKFTDAGIFYCGSKCSTLHDIARLTNGNIKLKDIEL